MTVFRRVLSGVIVLLILCSGCVPSAPTPPDETLISIDNIPAFDGDAFVVINGNEPFFTAEDITAEDYEAYSPLDSLGRCGTAMACVGKALMPTEERGNISSVIPSGWQNESYDFVDGGYVYNRCHLLGFQLTGENANEKNLITGTRYMNTEGMLPFENMVADYIKETDHHVLLRVTPFYDSDNLVASGVLMEAYSVEDNGEGVCFNVYCYNVQPGVTIDYATGHNHASPIDNDQDGTWILNTNTKKVHSPSCERASDIKDSNRASSSLSLETLEQQGYTRCQNCLG